MALTIEPMSVEDWPEVRRIYREGIATGDATFATDAPEWGAWDKDHLKACRLIARDGDKILGWAALSPVSGRCVYAGVAEVSVYVGADARGRGVGKRLLQALIEDSERQSLWTLQAGVFPENEASVATHRACGFREVGRRKKIGKMRDRWRDVLLLERRSGTVGR
jgi:phosphinothricin acetyltransferase